MTKASLIEKGMHVADAHVFEEDKIWSAHSRDKVDIGERLTRVLRTLMHALPLSTEMTGLSVGSSNEPQFRILEPACRAGLYLLDVEQASLDLVDDRLRRQSIDHVRTVRADYTKVLASPQSARDFMAHRLDGHRMRLIALHHSLYYSAADTWMELVESLYEVLAKRGAIHAVLMRSRSEDADTTTWLYNHFAGKFFGHRNDQDLHAFALRLKRAAPLRGASILARRSRVQFWVDDFEQFMAVIWMIMLYPSVHRYDEAQRREITEHVYAHFWKPRRPLIQEQDHVAIYRGIDGPVLL